MPTPNPSPPEGMHPDLRQGVRAYLTPDPSRTDLFQHEENHYHFPCNACIHVTKPADFCERCTHYVK